MNRFQIDGDIFSPIRLETSDADSSDDSENLSTISNSDRTVSFTRTSRNKRPSEANEIKSRKETNELKLNSDEEEPVPKKPDSLNICTPVSNRNSGNVKRDSKTLDLKLKLEKEESLQNVNVMKRVSSSKDSESHQKKQGYQQRKSAVDSNTVKSSSEQSNVTKKCPSRPTSLALSKNEVAKCSTKDMKKEKIIGQSSKNIYNVDDMRKSDAKHSGKKLIENSLDSKRTNRVKKFEDSCGKSTDSKSRSSSVHDSSNKKSDTKNQLVENSKPASNPSVHSPYEVLVENIVHDHISSECDKMRQNICAQQMSFYRELNKLKGEMERQHFATTERLIKITEELMQVNCSLKSVTLHE